MAAGAGMLAIATVGTFLILVVLSVLDRLEEFARRRMGITDLPEPMDEPSADGRTEDLP